VGASGTGGTSQVENLAAGLDEDLTDTTNDTSCDLGSEGVPDTVLDLRFAFFLALLIKIIYLRRSSLIDERARSFACAFSQ